MPSTNHRALCRYTYAYYVDVPAMSSAARAHLEHVRGLAKAASWVPQAFAAMQCDRSLRSSM
jgi:hypothetical protein